mmetsp:Transcript_20932/g.45462  ORF Transcript_20932/g.45462 Transcript_20932/m.45462 type:complete len:211 (+) Transcript_20932:1104-1736(+)
MGPWMRSSKKNFTLRTIEFTRYRKRPFLISHMANGALVAIIYQFRLSQLGARKRSNLLCRCISIICSITYRSSSTSSVINGTSVIMTCGFVEESFVFASPPSMLAPPPPDKVSAQYFPPSIAHNGSVNFDSCGGTIRFPVSSSMPSASQLDAYGSSTVPLAARKSCWRTRDIASTDHPPRYAGSSTKVPPPHRFLTNTAAPSVPFSASFE